MSNLTKMESLINFIVNLLIRFCGKCVCGDSMTWACTNHLPGVESTRSISTRRAKLPKFILKRHLQLRPHWWWALVELRIYEVYRWKNIFSSSMAVLWTVLPWALLLIRSTPTSKRPTQANPSIRPTSLGQEVSSDGVIDVYFFFT